MSKHDEIKLAAEESLLAFIRLIAPHRVLSPCHVDLIRWWTRDDAKSHQLTLMPRDHQKSALIAYRVAWTITKKPESTFLYISSTANLAEKQLKFIKDILTSKIYRRYWPEMVNMDEGRREKWTTSEIAVDHPIRKQEGVRDPTIFTGGLTTSLTGMHCSNAVLDDVVVQENAYTKEGRQKVKEQYSLLASIESADASEWTVGTRYHADDLYGSQIDMMAEEFDEAGNMVSQEPVYEVYQREVEDVGDGTGNYLWPRQQRYDGRWFGFDQRVLSRKRAQYLDRSQFRAQYYNNPNDPDNEVIGSHLFQKYDRKFLEKRGGTWTIRGKTLAVFAAIDFAFSLKATADYTAIAVVGVNSSGEIYVLEILRFRSNRITDYFDSLMDLHMKWGFRKLRAEVSVAQEVIVEELRARVREAGYGLSIDTHRPTRNEGDKAERIHAILAPRYESLSIWHYDSGSISDLEDELKQEHPRHDDLKDALASAVSISVVPKERQAANVVSISTHSRFGGVAFRG
jgi:hypothetical protein